MIIQSRNFKHTVNRWSIDVELMFFSAYYNENQDRYESDNYEFDGIGDDCLLITE